MDENAIAKPWPRRARIGMNWAAGIWPHLCDLLGAFATWRETNESRYGRKRHCQALAQACSNRHALGRRNRATIFAIFLAPSRLGEKPNQADMDENAIAKRWPRRARIGINWAAGIGPHLCDLLGAFATWRETKQSRYGRKRHCEALAQACSNRHELGRRNRAPSLRSSWRLRDLARN